MTMPRISFAALKLYAFALEPHDFLNLLFCALDGGLSVGVALRDKDGESGPVALGVHGANAAADDEPGMVVDESKERERGVLLHLGNIFGMLNPGEGGFDACGVLTAGAGWA